MKITFYKLQGAGNDFVAIDNRKELLSMEEVIALTPRLCDRKFGVGADGLLALFRSTSALAYTMVYRNADGSDAGMCGNGGRCIALLAHKLGIDPKHAFDVHGHIYEAEVTGNEVSISFPSKPRVETVPDPNFGKMDVIFTGTEHVCIEVNPSILDDKVNLRRVGRELRFDERFAPKGTNVNFYVAKRHRELQMVTYERGVEDLTLACGTGALAVSVAHARKLNESKGPFDVVVQCPGGVLRCRFNYEPTSDSFHSLILSGPAEIVFTGEIEI